MKVLTPFLLIFISFTAHAQNFSSSVEPTSLYIRANQSLNSGDTKHAQGIFKEVIDFYKSVGRTKELSESYLGMALAFALHGNYDESIRFHKKALRAHHRYRCGEADDEIRLNLGLTYQLAGKTRKARRFLPAATAYTRLD